MMRWLMYGSGVGIEIEPRELRVAVVRVRPNGAETVALHAIADYLERPAAEWGAEYAAFLKRHGLSHAAACAVVPRNEVTVRLLALPALKGDDLAAAVRYQVDGLHPYQDEDVAFSFARIGETSQVMVAMARHEVVERYSSLFAEAGVALAGFTVSAAALYSGRRVAAEGPYAAVLAMADTDGLIEVYGESEAKPVYSAIFPDTSAGRARVMAQAELRLPDETPVAAMYELAPSAALVSAMPRASLALNLLPEDLRRDHSKLWLAPTLALASLLLMLGGLLWYQGQWENKRLLTELEREIKLLEPRAAEMTRVDARIEGARAQVKSLDALRARTRDDLDALLELTRILPPPAWAQGVYLNDASVTVTGEAPQSESLLKVIDESPRFKNSEFMTSFTRGAGGESFQIRAQRETPASAALAPASAATPPVPAPSTLGGPPR